jgi:hypothetical protein
LAGRASNAELATAKHSRLTIESGVIYCLVRSIPLRPAKRWSGPEKSLCEVLPVKLTSRAATLLLFSLLGAAAPAFAHHSFDAEFDAKKLVTLTGVMTKIDWINPHIFFYMDVKDESGKVTHWSFETVPTGWMHRAGLTRDAFVVGQTYTVQSYLAKDGTKAYGDLHSITMPDGHLIVVNQH